MKQIAMNMPLKKFRSASAALLAVITCTGCAVGPDFHKPDAPQLNRYIRDPASEAGAVQASSSHLQWWKTFGSTELNELVASAFKQNPTVAGAQAALKQARSNTAAQFGAYFPQVQAVYSPSRQKNPVGTISPTLSSGDALYTLHTAQLNISYVPDLFGLNRRQVESLQAQEDAQRYQLNATYQTLAANLVAAVIQAAALQEQLDVAHGIVDASQDALNVLRKQLELGFASSLDVVAQENVLAQARQVVPGLTKQLEQTRDLIAVLCGVPPAELPQIHIALADLKLEQPVPLALPSQLVEQRPDVMAAEAQLHAATAQVGVAMANRLPQLSISASDGGSSTRFSSMFADGNKFWSLGGNLVQPLLDFGVLAHKQEAAQAALEQAKAQYQSTVLSAFQNVADSLYALKYDAQSLEASTELERVTRKTFDLTQRQRELGAVNSLAVLSVQQAYLQARTNVVQAKALRYLDTVALYQALGGTQ
jgi:NodT family efflux transporter outer membrane factor (OMF) lipoprotein